MAEVLCTECTWAGEYSETLSDVTIDEDGDSVGIAGACPECHAPTVDFDELDSVDLPDSRG